MFSLYAALVKNLRGVVLFRDYSEDIKDRVEWLRKRFKYRDLGIPPTLYESYRGELEKYMGGKPFRLLYYPIPKYKDLVEILRGLTGLDYVVTEAFVLSSLYISPLLVIDKELVDDLVGLGVETIYTDKELSVNDWKLHLRIADYTILDMYSEMIKVGLKIIEYYMRGDKDHVEKLLNERREKVKKDTKRYWRIKADSGKPFMTYIDLLSLLLGKTRELVIDKDWVAGLTIIPCVYIV